MMRNLVGCCLAFASVFWFACSASEADNQAEEEERAREEAEAEAEAEREAEAEAERQAEEAEKAENARRTAFCDEWTELYCRDQMKCHPDITAELLADCVGRLARYCDERMEYKDWRNDAAAECFDTADGWDCSMPLEEFFSDNCNDVIIVADASAQVGNSCSYSGSIQCGEGGVCELEPQQDGVVLDCDGTCVVSLQEGEDCAEAPCAEGLDCQTEEDDRGLSIRVCREDPFSTEPDEPSAEEANGCAPHEQFVEAEERCIANSLPGEGCGGSFDIDCLGATCEDGRCEWGISDPNTVCSGTSCMYPYECVRNFQDQTRCAVYDQSCSAHPMMLLN